MKIKTNATVVLLNCLTAALLIAAYCIWASVIGFPNSDYAGIQMKLAIGIDISVLIFVGTMIIVEDL